MTILLGSALLAAADGCGPSGKSLARGLALLFIPARAAVAYGGRFISVGKFGAFASDTGSKI